ncbi:MAG TPA: fused MFS/spermidine synthase, partial [Herpetosiphonaceae bacterium]|nr:fused MFS/spermidine synthase [Herpetosiphonaceae bacterium]
VPTSLLFGVTTHITTDLAAVPLLWVVPLALYLLSFIVAFARPPALRHAWMVAVQPFLIIAVTLTGQEDWPAWLLGLHLLAFFATAIVCHGELAQRRPGARHLTEFYLLISLGGVLGGMFNGLVAPVIFTFAYEYSIALVAACLLRPATAVSPSGQRLLDVLLLALLAAFLFAFPLVDPIISQHLSDGASKFLFIVIVATFLLAGCASRPVRFGLGVAVLLSLSPYRVDSQAVLHAERSFFGIYRVEMSSDESAVELHHGTTLHGAQFVEPERWREPLTYYHRVGPFGEFFAAHPAHGGEHIAVAGLGTGALACYALPGQTWTFYEIDPTVVRLARDTRYFHYLSECGASAQVVLGDARLSLKAAPDANFDVLVLDAFSSDAIPVHLLTREAVQLYLRKVAADGVVIFHVTNRHLDLASLLGQLAVQDGLAARYRGFWPYKNAGAETEWAYPVALVAIARRNQALAFLDNVDGWQPLAARADLPVWTDEHSNILSVLRWRD